jgi:D-sedoheptulose 7-phosphate isomerase
MYTNFNSFLLASYNLLNVLIKEPHFQESIEAAAKLLSIAANNGRPILVCGNGGSAADAMHIEAELVGRFLKERRPINVTALSANSSLLTALGNDFDYQYVFSRQVEGKGGLDGVLIAISTSGESRNILNAAIAAKKLGMNVVGLTKKGNVSLAEHCDSIICVPSESTPLIQQAHQVVYHYICAVVEEAVLER